MFLSFYPTPENGAGASVWRRGAALGVVEERSRAGAFEQNSALALFCAGSASTAEQGRRPRRLRQRSAAKRLRTRGYKKSFRMPNAVTIDPEITYALSIEELHSIVDRLKHRDGSARAGRDCERCHDGDRAPVINRPPGSRIEQMGIASTLMHEEAFVIARGCQCAARHIEVRDRCTRLSTWVLHRHAPRLTVNVRTDDTHIAAQVDEAVFAAKIYNDCGCPISCVLFTDSAKVDLHVRAQTQRWRIPFDL